MITSLVLSLWENRQRFGIVDVVLNSSLLDYNFIGCSGVAELQSFLKANEVDVIIIKTNGIVYNISVMDIEGCILQSNAITIILKVGDNICLM